MGRRGPAKTPTVLQLVKGNPGRRPMATNEPKPKVARPDAPDYLSDIAKTEWRRVCPLLADIGLMSEIDVAVLAAYCGAHSDLVESMQKQQGRSTVVKTHNGNWVQSPFVSMIRQARLDMIRFAAQMGMTPASRAGMSMEIGLPGNEADPASRFFDLAG